MKLPAMPILHTGTAHDVELRKWTLICCQPQISISKIRILWSNIVPIGLLADVLCIFYSHSIHVLHS